MATQLINVVSFTGLVVGVPTTLAHGLNINGTGVVPDVLFAGEAGYSGSVTSTTITVTRPSGAADSVDIFVWRIHSSPRSLGALSNLTPQPFIVESSITGLIGFTSIWNTGLGVGAGAAIASGTQNALLGNNAGQLLEDGGNCVAIGYGALSANTDAFDNTAVGYNALRNCTTDENTAVGSGALEELTTGTQNTAMGYRACGDFSIRNQNCAFGWEAMVNSESDQCVAVGVEALSDSDGDRNCALGYQAGVGIRSGTDNVEIGYAVGPTLSSGSSNVLIGSGVDASSGVSGAIAIGRSAAGAHAIATANNSLYFHNALAAATGSAVHYNSTTGQMGPNTSSRRFKEDITDMEQDASKIFGLRPVSFNWKPEHLRGPRTFGFIAEEVAEVFPESVPRDSNGECMSVNYEQLVVPIVAVMKQQQKTIEALFEDLAYVKSQLSKLTGE